MPGYASPYAPSRQYDYSQTRSIGDLMRSRLDVQAQQQMRRGDASQQMWSNLGNSAAGTIAGILKDRQDRPIREQQARTAALNETHLRLQNEADTATIATAKREEEARTMVDQLPFFASGEGRDALLAAVPGRARELLMKQYQDLDEHSARMGQIAAATTASTANTQQSQQAIAQGNIDTFGLIGYHVRTAKYNPTAYYAGVADAVTKKLITAQEAGPLIAQGIQNPDGMKAIVDTWIEHSPATLDRLAKEKAATLAQTNTDADNKRLDAAQRSTETYQRGMLEAAQTTANAAMARAKAAGAGLDEAMPDAYQNALGRALVGVPATRRPATVALMNNLWAQGDKAQMGEVIQQAALANEPVATQTLITGRRATVAALQDLRAQLMKVPTGLVTGTIENTARRLGKTTNPELAKLGAALTDALINYRHANTGAAFGAIEDKDYRSLIPNYSNDLPVNMAVLDGLAGAMASRDRDYWEHKLGAGGSVLVGAMKSYGSPPPSPPATTDAATEAQRLIDIYSRP